MSALTPDNLFAYSAQIAAITLLAGVLPTLLRLTSPVARHAYWRAVLALCVLLPWLQTAQRVAPRSSETATVSVAVTAVAPATATPSLVLGPVWSGVLVALLAAGCLVRIAWLGIGWTRLRRLCAQGEPVPYDDSLALLARSSPRPEVRYLSDLQQPVMFGLFRPVILLPAILRHEAVEIRQAVLAHEIGHVHRRDWFWVAAEELVRAVLWFHPAIWWLIDRVRAAREELVDRLAVTMTGERGAYLRALLKFADGAPFAPVAAFGQRRHLFHRIVQISREDVMSSKRLVVTCVVLAGVVGMGGWYATRAFPMTQVADSPLLQREAGPIERAAKAAGPDHPVPVKIHDVTPVYPQDPVAREISARVTIRATVDENGAVAETRVVGLDLAFQRLRWAMQGENMARQLDMFLTRSLPRFSAGEPEMPAGTLRPAVNAILESAVTAVSQWQYEPPANGPVAFDLTIHFNGTKPAAAVPEVSQDSPLASGALRVGGGIKPPTKTHDIRPVYPPEAQQSRVQGIVVLEVRIEEDGHVGQARVLRGVPMLDEAALDAVRQWQFTPTLMNGAPIPVVMAVTVNFTLAEK